MAAVDLNLGCPQEIARAGGYGAFLLEEAPRAAAACVASLAAALAVPVTAKVRLQPSAAATLDACRAPGEWPWLDAARGQASILGITNALEARPHKVRFRVAKQSSDPKGSQRFQLIGLLTVAQARR